MTLKWYVNGANIVKQLLFPRRCPICDRIVIPFGEKLCPRCAMECRFLTPPYCMKCGKKLSDEAELCGDCRKKPHIFSRGRALYEYESVAFSIYRMKYGSRQEYAEYFGEELAYYLGSFIRDVNPDALIPVPLHRKRERRRGYNQAALLAKAMGKHLGVPVLDNYLVRVKNTTPLKWLNPKERENNLKKAFNIVQNDVKLKRVVLVDDIYTTGSTMDEAAGTLAAHGVEEIYFVALACGAGI